MTVINQNSFILIAGTILVILFLVLVRRGLGQTEWIALGALLIGLSVAYFFFNPGESSLNSSDELASVIGSGQATLLEFQSPY